MVRPFPSVCSLDPDSPSSGHIVLFHVARALETGTSRIRPSQYLEIHDAAIRHVSWIQTPPLSPTADPLLDGEPTHLVSAGMDGSSFLIDLRDSGSPVTLSHMRGTSQDPLEITNRLS